MQLNSIVYDVNSLATAITEQWNAESTTFQSIYPSDTATSLINGFSAYGAMLQYMLVSAMANCYTTTAFSEAGIYQLADTLGNSLHGNVSSQVLVNVTKNNFIGTNIIVPANSQFEISGKKFFNPSAIILPAITPTVTEVVLIQGEYIEVNKYSSGIENEKFYFSSDFKANHNYVKVKVNGEEWTVADSFLPYDKNYVIDISEMNTVVLKTDPDGRSYIKVGNNQLGSMPASGSNIQIQYVSNDGKEGNIEENNTQGSLLSVLSFLDSNGNQANLDLTITTTTTAYGGFSKQSLETLRYTSPFIFASGHRAIRRQDYNALLQNQCGYLTSAVWGEYEEANKVGAYDSLMMNMVYYTGIKDFETYPPFTIGEILSPYSFIGTLNSTSGFWGSFIYKIQNLKDTTKNIIIEDTGAKGQLFNNDNVQDPRDSLLPDWISTTTANYTARLAQMPFGNTGSDYNVGDELTLPETNNEITLRVTEINSRGGVVEVRLLKNSVKKNYTINHPMPFETAYLSSPGRGTGLTINLVITGEETSSLIYTNDHRDTTPAPAQNHPITNARSDKPKNLYYQSLYPPTLLQPVQIIVKYGNIEKAIVGVKFRASDSADGKFIGSMAMFGTNIEPMPSLENVRNSENWTKLINLTFLPNPLGNTNDNWTNWYPTNCFTGRTDSTGKPEYNRYKYYVIEIYSTEDEADVDALVTINKLKFLYDDEASIIYYANNGKTELRFPIAGSPGPGGTEDGYLTTNLLNTTAFPQYEYKTEITGVISANGYRDGNILAYIFKNGDSTIPFLVEVVNIDNGIFKVTSAGNETLTGTEKVQLAAPGSLDEILVYRASLVLESGRIPLAKGGQNYKPNDIVTVNDTNGDLKLRVVTVDQAGTVITAVWLNDLSLNKAYNGEYTTTLTVPAEEPTGTGLVVDIKSTLCSGRNGVPGVGGKIMISSSNNLQVNASFSGNRLDTAAINRLDQPIIDQYNHFTTFLEFKQPEIVQIKISAKVSISKNSPITSGVVLQNVKNNITALFEITPDYIGKGLKISDIYQAIMKTKYVDWCKVITPLDNIEVEKNVLMILSSVDVIEAPISFK